MADENPRELQINIAYHFSPYPNAMRSDLAEIAGVCDGIYLPFTESDLAYRSRALRACVDIAHEFNLQVLADFWGYGNLFACGAVPSLFTVQHPECNCVSNLGRPIPKSCPNKRSVRAFMREAVESFLSVYGADGVFWDEPHYELGEYLGTLKRGEWVCRCDDCQRLFKKQYGKEMPVRRTKEVDAFRANTMLSFLSELCGYVKGCGQHLLTSTCVMTSDSRVFREAVARTKGLDIYGIDPYWRPEQDEGRKDFIDQYTCDTLEIGHAQGKLVESWACAWKQNAGCENDAYVAAKLMAAHEIDYLSAWSYRDYVSWDSCQREGAADSERVWQGLRRAFHEIREGNVEIPVPLA